MLPIAADAVLVGLLPSPLGGLAETGAVMWGGAILAFLAGVRRGVSFRTPGGPHVAQIVTMLWLFVLGIAALVARLLPACRLCQSVDPGSAGGTSRRGAVVLRPAAAGADVDPDCFGFVNIKLRFDPLKATFRIRFV